MINKLVLKFNPKKLLFIVFVCELINVFYYVGYLYQDHYLPAPFVANKNDTLMDFYNPLFWVIKDSFYTTFNSVYPALNYFLLKIFAIGISPDQVSNSFQLRNDFPELALIISFIYLLIIWVVVNIGEWKKIQFCNKALIFLACAISVPVLFALERGNLIFFALLFLGLYLNASNSWSRAIFLGLLINVKPYFVLLLIQYLNIKQFNKFDLVRSLLTTALIFFGFSFFVGINYVNFFEAFLSFSKNTTLTVEGVVALPHSIAALSTIKALINFGEGSRYTFWFSLLKVINYSTVAVLLYITLSRKLSPLELLIACIVLLTNFSISTGGYILIIYITLIPYLIQSKEYKNLIIYILLIAVLPVDYVGILSINYDESISWLGKNYLLQNHDFYISLGSLIRPLLNFSLMTNFLWLLLKKYPNANAAK